MSITSAPSSSHTNAPSDDDNSSRRNDSKSPDPTELREQGQLFRNLMESPVTAQQLAAWAARTGDPRESGKTPGEMARDGRSPWAGEGPNPWSADSSGSHTNRWSST